MIDRFMEIDLIESNALLTINHTTLRHLIILNSMGLRDCMLDAPIGEI